MKGGRNDLNRQADSGRQDDTRGEQEESGS